MRLRTKLSRHRTSSNKTIKIQLNAVQIIPRLFLKDKKFHNQTISQGRT